MANLIDETGATYLTHLRMQNSTYTIKDAWARAEIAEIEQAIAGGVHFRGVLSNRPGNTISDGEAVKTLYVGKTEKEIPAESQVDGDLFIYNNGSKNLEFIVSDGKYSEFGSTGALGAFAFANSGSGTAIIPLQSSIAFGSYTPLVSKGTLGITYQTESVAVTTTEATASGKFSPAAITIGASSVTLTPTKGTFSALADVTYDSATATLSIINATSDEFWKSATGEVAAKTVTPTANQTISVTYDKVNSMSINVMKNISLTGELAVTPATPTATITNPTITVTVTPTSS